MPPPILTPTEIAQIQTEQAAQTATSGIFAAQGPAKTARIAELQVVDGGFAKFFLYYNTDIIGNYDSERRALDGAFDPAPILEQDIIDVSEITGRLVPTSPVTDVVRVSNFDGNEVSSDPLNETTHNVETASTSDILQNGYGAGTATSAQTLSVLLPGSVTLNVTNLSLETIQAGDVYILDDGSEIAVIQVNTIVDGGGSDPPYLSDLGVTLIVPPTTSLAAGATFAVFTGFSNGERAAKVASNPAYQPLMDSLTTDLEGILNSRITALDTQDTAINANQDPDGAAQLSAALVLNSVARVFIQNYLISTDISDTGLISLASERITRGSEITTRLAEIAAAYTSQTENYYDRRYALANDRGNVLRGTLRVQKITEASLATSQVYAQNASDSAASLGSILP